MVRIAKTTEPAGEAKIDPVALKPLSKEELLELCELKTRFVAKEKMTDEERVKIGLLSQRPNSENIGISCVRCGKITYIPKDGTWRSCRHCRTKPLSVGETNELTILLTKSLVNRQLEPEQMRRLGSLRDAAIETKLKITNHKCTHCKRPFVLVEGTTLAGCHMCANRMN